MRPPEFNSFRRNIWTFFGLFLIGAVALEMVGSLYSPSVFGAPSNAFPLLQVVDVVLGTLFIMRGWQQGKSRVVITRT